MDRHVKVGRAVPDTRPAPKTVRNLRDFDAFEIDVELEVPDEGPRNRRHEPPRRRTPRG